MTALRFQAGGGKGGWGEGTSDIPSLPSGCTGRIHSCDCHKRGPQAKMWVWPKEQKMCKHFHLQASHGGFTNMNATEALSASNLALQGTAMLVCSLPLKKSVTRTLIYLCESFLPFHTALELCLSPGLLRHSIPRPHGISWNRSGDLPVHAFNWEQPCEWDRPLRGHGWLLQAQRSCCGDQSSPPCCLAASSSPAPCSLQTPNTGCFLTSPFWAVCDSKHNPRSLFASPFCGSLWEWTQPMLFVCKPFLWQFMRVNTTHALCLQAISVQCMTGNTTCK